MTPRWQAATWFWCASGARRTYTRCVVPHAACGAAATVCLRCELRSLRCRSFKAGRSRFRRLRPSLRFISWCWAFRLAMMHASSTGCEVPPAPARAPPLCLRCASHLEPLCSLLFLASPAPGPLPRRPHSFTQQAVRSWIASFSAPCSYLATQLQQPCYPAATLLHCSYRAATLPHCSYPAAARQPDALAGLPPRRCSYRPTGGGGGPVRRAQDLKPQNVLVSSAGVLKIADFGLAAPQLAHAPPQTAGVATRCVFCFTLVHAQRRGCGLSVVGTPLPASGAGGGRAPGAGG